MSYICEHGFVHHKNVGRCPKCTEARILLDAATEQADHLRRLVELQTSARDAAPPSSADARKAEFDLCLRSARKCLEIDELDAATQQLDQAAALLPAEAELYVVRALLAERRGDPTAAVTAREKAFRLSGGVHHGLAYAAALTPAAAAPVLDQLLQRHPRVRDVVVAVVANRQLRGAWGSPAEGVAALLAIAPTADELRRAGKAVEALAGAGAGWVAFSGALDARVSALAADEARRAQEEEARRQRAAAEAARKREAEELARVEAELERDAQRRRKAEQEARSYAIGTVLMAPVAAAFLGLMGGVVLAPVFAVANDFATLHRRDGSYRAADPVNQSEIFFEQTPCGRGCQGGFRTGAVLGALLGVIAVVRRND